MAHDVNFNELTTSTEIMDSDDMTQCIDNLREMIADGKAQWDKLAAILQVDGDDVDTVFAAARVAMAGLGGSSDQSEIQRARETFPAFAELYRHLDAACLHEMERFNRHCDELADMSLDQFMRFKEQSAKDSVGRLEGPRRWWREETARLTGWRKLWHRISSAVV